MTTTGQKAPGGALTGQETARKANFFIVGAPKCGTTAWYDYLRSHPEIFFPDLKEPCFFAHDFPSLRHAHSDEDYARLFADARAARIRGDASADYLFSEKAAAAISDYNPEAKILILLRGQDEYLPALHNQHLMGFWEDIEDFERAWKLSGGRSTNPDRCSEPRMLDYAALGRFAEQVKRYLDAFPRGQILVLRFEEWVTEPRRAYLEVLTFLGLEDDGRRAFPRVNEGRSYRSHKLARMLTSPPAPIRTLGRAIKRATGLENPSLMLLDAPRRRILPPELREEIRRYFAEDNRRLEEMLRS